MFPRRPSVLASRAAIFGAAVFGAVIAFAVARVPAAGARAKPEFSTGAMYNGRGGPQCGAGMRLMSSAMYRGTSVALLPAPVASLRDNELRSPVVAVSAETPADRRWQLSAGGAVGRAESDCAPLSDRNCAWASMSHRFGRNGLSLTFGGPGLSTLDPSRARQGVTLGAWRSMGRTGVSFDLRQHATGGNDWRRFSRTELTSVAFPNDTMPGGVDSMRTPTQVPDSAPTPVQWRGVDVRTRLE